jgi:hypothetical protein
MILGLVGLRGRLQNAAGHRSSPDRHGGTVQEIAASDTAIHAKVAVAKWIYVVMICGHF